MAPEWYPTLRGRSCWSSTAGRLALGRAPQHELTTVSVPLVSLVNHAAGRRAGVAGAPPNGFLSY